MFKNHKKEELSEQEKVNRKVDAMLNPNSPDAPPAKKGEAPPLDIFKDAPPDVAKATRTAPEVSGKLLDGVDDSVEIEPRTASPEPPAKTKTPAGRQPQPQGPPRDSVGRKDPLEDTETDRAVTDIAAKEGNTLLALQDAIGRKASRLAGNLAEQDRKTARRRHWSWLIFLVVFVILILLVLPLNSYTCRWPVGIRLRVTTDILPSVCK